MTSISSEAPIHSFIAITETEVFFGLTVLVQNRVVWKCDCKPTNQHQSHQPQQTTTTKTTTTNIKNNSSTVPYLPAASTV
jgi:hypothetical protein